MRERRARSARARRRRPRVAAKRARQCATTSASTAASGRLHSPPQMPAAGRFSNRIVPGAFDDEHAHRALRQRFSRPRRRQRRDALLDARDAIARDGTVAAARRAARADRRAEIHQRLRVRFDVAFGQQRVGDAPQFALRPSARPDSPRCRDGARARASRCRRGSRRAAPNANAAIAAAVVRPMPGSVASVSTSRGNSPPMLGDDRLRRRMQVMRAAVVAESAPVLEHAIVRRGGQRAHVGERGEKALVVRDDRRDLRLLQHDLGQPDPVRVARALPRQVVAAVRRAARRRGARQTREGAGKPRCGERRRASASRRDAASP